MGKLIESQGYIGDMEDDQAFAFWFSSCNKNGASVDITTLGTIRVGVQDAIYSSSDGITITQGVDSIVGLHRVIVDISASAYLTPGKNYIIGLLNSVVDSETVSSILCHFSIEHRLK